MANMVLENMANVSELVAKVKAHPMCYDLKENKSDFLVFFPMGFAVDGVRVAFKTGVCTKQTALQRLLEKMEHYWQSSSPTYKCPSLN